MNAKRFAELYLETETQIEAFAHQGHDARGLKELKNDYYRWMLQELHTDDATWPNGRELALYILRGV